MKEADLDRLISAVLITAFFFVCISFYFVFTDGKILNLENSVIYTYVVLPIAIFINWVLGKLKLNILNDICKIF